MLMTPNAAIMDTKPQQSIPAEQEQEPTYRVFTFSFSLFSDIPFLFPYFYSNTHTRTKQKRFLGANTTWERASWKRTAVIICLLVDFVMTMLLITQLLGMEFYLPLLLFSFIFAHGFYQIWYERSAVYEMQNYSTRHWYMYKLQGKIR